MAVFPLLRRLKEFYSWYSFAVGVSALFVTGFGLAVGGAVWLIRAGIPIPLALMAGYCTLVGAVYLAMAPVAFRALRQTVSSRPAQKTVAAPKINYTAIRLQHQYTLLAASQLCVGLSPTSSTTNHDSNSWCETFSSAVQQGKLRFEPRWTESDMIKYERANPSVETIVRRDELKRYAASIGQDPIFLRDN